MSAASCNQRAVVTAAGRDKSKHVELFFLPAAASAKLASAFLPRLAKGDSEKPGQAGAEKIALNPPHLHFRQRWTLLILWKRRASSYNSWQVLEPEDVVDLHSTDAQPALG